MRASRAAFSIRSGRQTRMQATMTATPKKIAAILIVLFFFLVFLSGSGVGFTFPFNDSDISTDKSRGPLRKGSAPRVRFL